MERKEGILSGLHGHRRSIQQCPPQMTDSQPLKQKDPWTSCQMDRKLTPELHNPAGIQWNPVTQLFYPGRHSIRISPLTNTLPLLQCWPTQNLDPQQKPSPLTGLHRWYWILGQKHHHHWHCRKTWRDNSRSGTRLNETWSTVWKVKIHPHPLHSL